jgi:hypothetical protein
MAVSAQLAIASDARGTEISISHNPKVDDPGDEY